MGGQSGCRPFDMKSAFSTIRSPAMPGRIRVLESELGRGMAITIRIPDARVAAGGCLAAKAGA